MCSHKKNLVVEFIAIVFLSFFCLASSPSKGEIRFKEDVILGKHKESLAEYFDESARFQHACDEMPRRVGSVSSFDPKAIAAWVREYSLRKGEKFWFMRSAGVKYLNPKPHRYHTNHIEWRVSFESLITGEKARDPFLLHNKHRDLCIEDKVDGLNTLNGYTDFLGPELSYFLGFYKFPSGSRAPCSLGIRPTIPLIIKGLKELSQFMPRTFGLWPYPEEHLNNIAKYEIVKGVLPVKLRKDELLKNKRFLVAYQYLEEFISRGGIPIAESGHLYEHDISIHLFALFAFPELWQAYRETVKIARDSILHLDYRNKGNYALAIKVIENLVDFVDTLTFQTMRLLFEYMSDAINTSSYDPQIHHLDTENRIQKASLHFSKGAAINIGESLEMSYFKNYRVSNSDSCSTFPCPPIDILHGILKSESIYKEIKFSKAELSSFKLLVDRIEQDEKFSKPVAFFGEIGPKTKTYGEMQINFIQTIDIALEAWKKAHDVEFIFPN